MNAFIRSAVVAGVAGVVFAVGAVPAAVASAASDPACPATVWGCNTNGWNVIIHNNTGYTLKWTSGVLIAKDADTIDSGAPGQVTGESGGTPSSPSPVKQI